MKTDLTLGKKTPNLNNRKKITCIQMIYDKSARQVLWHSESRISVLGKQSKHIQKL